MDGDEYMGFGDVSQPVTVSRSQVTFRLPVGNLSFGGVPLSSSTWVHSTVPGSSGSDFSAVGVAPNGSIFASCVIRGTAEVFYDYGNDIEFTSLLFESPIIVGYSQTSEAVGLRSVVNHEEIGPDGEGRFVGAVSDGESHITAVGWQKSDFSYQYDIVVMVSGSAIGETNNTLFVLYDIE